MLSTQARDQVEKAWRKIADVIELNKKINMHYGLVFHDCSQPTIIVAYPYLEITVAVDTQEVAAWSDEELETKLHQRLYHALKELRIRIDEHLLYWGKQ